MFPIIVLLVALLSAGTPVNQAPPDHEFLTWSKKDCEKVLKRHTKRLNISDTHWGTLITGGVGGMGKAMEAEDNFFVWLSEPASKAYARLIQVKAHLTDEETLEILEQIRPPETSFFSIVMFTRSADLSTVLASGIEVGEGDKPGQLGKPDENLRRNLFLLDEKKKERAARIQKMEPLPDEIIVPAASRYDTAFGSLLRFSRTAQDGDALVKDLKAKVVVSFFRLGKERKTEFKLKDFRLSSTDEL